MCLWMVLLFLRRCGSRRCHGITDARSLKGCRVRARLVLIWELGSLITQGPILPKLIVCVHRVILLGQHVIQVAKVVVILGVHGGGARRCPGSHSERSLPDPTLRDRALIVV